MKTVALPNERLLPDVVKLLSEGNSVTIKAKGNSMLPFIVGNRDSVTLVKTGSLHPGDIVLAEVAPLRFVLHRIIRIQPERVILMGDGNIRGTEQCELKNIAGRAVTIIRNGEHIDCDGKGERVKAMVWRRMLPVRRYLLAIYKRVGF